MKRSEQLPRTSFVHSTNIVECLLCARLCGRYQEPRKADLLLGLRFSRPRMENTGHVSQGGLTIRRNNPCTQGLNNIEGSHLGSKWVLSRSLLSSDLGNPGSFHFVALPFPGLQNLLVDSLHLVGRWWKSERVKNCAGGFLGLTWKWQLSGSAQNLVIWSCLTTKKPGKCSLAV